MIWTKSIKAHGYLEKVTLNKLIEALEMFEVVILSRLVYYISG